MVISISGLNGAAIRTFVLARIDPCGITDRIISLGVIALLTDAISGFGMDAVIQEYYKRGESK